MSVHKPRNILITSEIVGDHVNVLLAGELNSDSAPRFEKEIRDLIYKGQCRLVVSMEHLNLITSAGLRVLLVLAKELRRMDGNIALYAPKPNVREIFEITGFDSILDLSDTYEDAVFAMGPVVASGYDTAEDPPAKRTFH